MTGGPENPFGWLFLSDVCKHCGNAGCLEACPTAAIFRTEVGSVYVQDDVCNGCGYCVVGCPFGVIDRRTHSLPGGGGAFKCTFCYDRQMDGLTPACAKACPTESILFGPLDELRLQAKQRVEDLQGRGFADAQIYDPVGYFGRRNSRILPSPGESGAVRTSAAAGGADDIFAGRVVVGGRDIRPGVARSLSGVCLVLRT